MMQSVMINNLRRCFPLIVALVITALLALPCTSAYADVQDSSQEELTENSWRYSNGVPTHPSESTLSLQSEESAQSAQSRSLLLLKPVGIDVSQWQGTIDWAKVAQTNVEYAIIRCGYGSDTAAQDDRQWLNNVKGCKENNIPFGVYIYSYAYDVEMATSEAWHVVHALERAGLQPSEVRFPIYYDIEQFYDKEGKPDENYEKLTPDDYNQMWLAFKKVLNDAGYSKVGVYASASWWKNRLHKISVDSDYIWYARYGTNDPDDPLKPTDNPFNGFESLSSKGLGIWQYSSKGTVDGISGSVDMNYCRADLPFYYPKGTTLDMYRLYNPYSGEHLYTTNARECATLPSLGWKYEGIGWISPKESDAPVYRLYNPYSGDHHYTMSKEEYDTLCSIGWKGEDIGWYSDANQSIPLHRLFNPYESIGTHHYTTDEHERDVLTDIGWKYEGIGWYGM